MSTKVGFGWVRGFRWVVAACVLLGIALAARAWEDDTASLSVRLRAGLSAAEQAAVIARHGGTGQSAVAPLCIHVVRVPAADLPAVLDAYRADPEVESAEAVHRRRAEWLPNDPQIGSQWALERIGWPAVYSTQTPAGTATVALLDTGVDGAHPDLAGRLLPGTSFIDGSDGRTDPSGHGTRLAGLIAAVADNGAGIAGVAYAGVKVMPVTVLDAGGGGDDSQIIAGIVWAADHGADVILMGFSGPDPSRHLQDAIDYAWAKGAVLVAPTGNGGLETPTYPAADRGVIAISATGEDDGLAGFSNRGPDVFLAAPGVALATTEGADGYTAVSGTSAAAALVAGTAALIKALDPTLTNAVLIGRLARGAEPAAAPQDPDYAAKYGYGRLSLGGALADALTADAMDPVEPVGVLVAAGGEGASGAGASAGGGALSGSAPATGGRVTSPKTSSLAIPVGPTVSIPGTSNLGANQVTLNLQSSATGTGWFTLLTGHSADCGSGGQIKAGQDGRGAPALRRGSLPLTAGTAGSYTVRNLIQSSDYRVCLTADDGTTLQETPAATSFNTRATAASSATWGTLGSAGFSAGEAYHTALAFAPDGTPYVVYLDGGNSYHVTVMKFDGTAWVNVGNAGFSAESADYTSLAFAPDGTPYVAYVDRDPASSNRTTVMKFDGISWVTVGGSAGFASLYGFTSLAFAPEGTPYVAYTNEANSVTVMKFDGTSWVSLGSDVFSGRYVRYASLAFAPDGIPYLAGGDTLMRFDGTSWVRVPSTGFSSGEALYSSLAFAPDGTPYLAYADQGSRSRATVMKFDGTSLVTLDYAGPSSGAAWFTSLAFAPDGNPYLAFGDDTNSGKATVMRFRDGAWWTTRWVTVGSVGFSAGLAACTSLAFDRNGTPYVAYTDYGNGARATVMRLVPAPTATTITLGSTPNPANVGTAVTFTASVNPAGATGSVIFMDGTTTLGTGTLSTGTTTFSTGTLGLGDHSITAVYGGDSNYVGSTSTVLTQTINLKEDQTIAFANPGPRVYGTTPTLVATASSGLPVTLRTRTATVCTVTADGALGFLTIGTCTIDADQAGDTTYNPAPRVSQTFRVTPAVLTLDSPVVMPKVYDGTAAAVIIGTLSGIVGTDQVTLNGTGTFASVGAGTGIPIIATATLDGADATNYTLTQPDGLTGTIVPRPVTVTADARSKAYGAADPPLTYQVTAGSLVDGDGFSGGLIREPGEAPGTYAITQGTLSLGTNYALGYVGATLTIVVPPPPPTVSIPGTSNLGANQVTLSLESSATGTGWFTLLAGSGTACGSGDQVKAGQDGSGAQAFRRGSLTLTANTAGTYTVHNLTQSTAYRVCFTADDAGSLQGTPVTADLTTTAATALSTAWVSVGSAGFSAGQATNTSLAFAPDGTPYVAYADGGNSGKATVMKFDGTAWVTVGRAGLSYGWAYSISLVFAADGTPYVAYTDGGNGNGATVMKFDGTDWVSVGGVASTGGSRTSLAFGSDGALYLAYDDAANSGRATVMTFTGRGWVPVGQPGFSPGAAYSISLAVAPDGSPYVVYENSTHWPEAPVMMVMKFDGTAWVPVGDAAFSELIGATFSMTSLAFAPDGTLYLAYDKCWTCGVVVRKYDGGAWVIVGNGGLFARAWNPSLAFAPDGTPYVAQLEGFSDGMTVVEFDGTSWVTVGNGGLPTGQADETALAFAPDGTPYVAYSGWNGAVVMKLLVASTTTVTTTVPGQRVQVDGTSHPAPYSTAWTPGSTHTIAVADTQPTGTGSRLVFTAWSDGGARSHTVTAPATGPVTYTASLITQYQLTTAVSPGTAGYVLPPSGGWYAAGRRVEVAVTPNTGQAFVDWSGGVADPGQAATTVTMDGPRSVTANLAPAPALRAMVAGKSGDYANRTWTIAVTNGGGTTASAVQVTGIAITSWSGKACTPQLKSALPQTLGELAAGARKTLGLTLDLRTCDATSRFAVEIRHRYGSGAGTTGSNRYTAIPR